jgi:hypothetical protein
MAEISKMVKNWFSTMTPGILIFLGFAFGFRLLLNQTKKYFFCQIQYGA